MRRALFVLGAVLLYAIPAAAQESGQVGLSVGFPGSIGIIWHASDAIAIRPDFSFSHSHSEGSTSDITTNSVGFGVSALFYTGKVRDSVRTYLAPRFGYARTITKVGGPVTNPETHQNSYQYSGSFGVQYTPTRRFSVYGEAGIVYTDSEAFFDAGTTGILTGGTSTNTAFGTRAGVGVVLYFK
jgi:opacity protein-like surface antigen